MIDDIDLLLTYLQNGDLFGFLMACYTTRIGQVFYAMITLILSVPLYNRTQSLIYCVILWFVLGGLFLVSMPIVSPVAVLLLTFAIVGLLFTVFTELRS